MTSTRSQSDNPKTAVRRRLSIHRKSAFTFVELLVVVVVILVLAALLAPVAKGVLARARNTQCVTNLKQLYVGAMAYAQDNNMEIPVDRSNPATGTSWFGALKAYVPHAGYGKKAAPYFCPSNPMKVVASGNRGWTSYAVNQNLYLSDAAAAKDPDYASIRKGLRFQQIFGVKAFFLDSYNGSTTDPAADYRTSGDRDARPWSMAHAVHGQSINVILTDGHVESPRVEPRPEDLRKGMDLLDLKAEWFLPITQ